MSAEATERPTFPEIITILREQFPDTCGGDDSPTTVIVEEIPQ